MLYNSVYVLKCDFIDFINFGRNSFMKPIVLVIMDGVGKGDGGSGDAVKLANTPTLDNLFATCPTPG